MSLFSCCCADNSNSDSIAVINTVPAISDERAAPAPPAKKEEPPPPAPVETKAPEPEPAKPEPPPAPKVAEPQAPAIASKEFTINLDKTGDGDKHMGLSLDALEGGMVMVCQIKDGIVKWYNQSVAEDDRLKPGDYIIEVNGARGDIEKMRQGLNGDGKIAMVVRRPGKFEVTIDKAGSVLGIELSSIGDTGISLLIREVREGAVKKWNTDNPGREVKMNDRIMSATNVATGATVDGDAIKLVEMLKVTEKVKLSIARV